MKLFKISTIALAMALTGWGACGNDSGGSKTDVPVLTSTGGAIAMDGPSGTGGISGTGGATTKLDAAATPDAPPDVPIGLDASVTVDVSIAIDAAITLDGPAVDRGLTIDTAGGEVALVVDPCAGLTAAQCHDHFINGPTDPAVSALDPGANPAIPYPTCSAQ
jgi:hypothetical protein